MDLLLRGLNPATIKKIDELAKKSDVSRQIYLKEHLEAFAINDLHTNIIQRYEKQLETNMLLLEKTNQTLESLVTTFEELMNDE